MEETIAAIATAPGEGGIGIVRISGESSKAILESIFTRVKKEYRKNFNESDGCGEASESSAAPSAKKFFLPEAKGESVGIEILPRMMHYGYVRDNFTGELIDEVMAVYFKAPYSYTAEDVVEIQCHGSLVSLRKLLALVIKNGARLAEPGEFTKRAFLNGRLDLSQAEAVIDLIRAKSDRSFDVALDHLEGKFSQTIREIRNHLMDCLVNISVNIDYPDEDIEQLTFEKLTKTLTELREELRRLLKTADTGRIITEGFKVSIIGKPNVGKSSLMNSLLRETRAIVTAIPGTTRDTIEEMLTIRGIPVKLTDTAGIRKTDDIIEKIGIEKSKEAFNNADLLIFMLDRSRPLDDEDLGIIEYIKGRKVIVVINKSDLAELVTREQAAELLPNALIIETSMTSDTGINEIENIIEEMVYGGNIKQSDSMVVTNVRHKTLLEEAAASIGDAIEMAKQHQPLEFLEIDVNRTYECLGSIIGEAVEDDIINEVFSRFCLGK